MGWYPLAVRKEITRHRTPMRAYRAIVLHVAAVEADSLYGYFNRPGNPTSHFYIRYDGTCQQYVDTRYQAPAQLEGNPSCIGIETEGLGSGKWTAQQVHSLAALCRWLHEQHQIPLTAMPDSKPASQGVAPHRWGINPWRVVGGESWSNSQAKTCPGNDRMSQVEEVILLASFTDSEVSDLKAIVKAIRDKGSNPAFMSVAINHVRGHAPQHDHPHTHPADGTHTHTVQGTAS